MGKDGKTRLKSGPKPSCLCGNCRVCKHREARHLRKTHNIKPRNKPKGKLGRLDQIALKWLQERGLR